MKNLFAISTIDPQKYVRLYEYEEGQQMAIAARAAIAFNVDITTIRLMVVDKVMAPGILILETTITPTEESVPDLMAEALEKETVSDVQHFLNRR